MLLSVEHTTSYRYSAPARYSIQYLRMTPRADPGQIIRRWAIQAPGKLTDQVDAFGNLMQVMVVNGPHDGIEISVSGEVETTDSAGVSTMDIGPIPLPFFLEPTALAGDDAPVRDFAAPLATAMAADRLDGLHRLSRAVAQAVRYETASTSVYTSASEALSLGRGVCQDQAHVFAAAARVMGVPTRYVSGYVHIKGDGMQETASHAWAESWVDDLGWVAFDVTNEICPTDAHVRLAVGPDYLACAPSRGMRRGGGEEHMEVQVTVLDRQGETQ